GQRLSLELVEQYALRARWLNLLHRLGSERGLVPQGLLRQLRRGGWQAFRQQARLHGAGLPGSYRRLNELLNKYRPAGSDQPDYGVIINGRTGNSHARKVDPVALDVLLELLAFPRQMDYPQVRLAYNHWAVANGRKPLKSDRSVGNYADAHEKEILHKREGRQAHYNKLTKVIHRRPVSIPLALANADDNSLDLNFVSLADGRTQKNYTAYIIMDTHLGYPLGYALAETPSFELIRLAALNAIHHIYELTGQWAVWQQLQADRFAHKQMKAWAELHCTYTPAPARKARGKHIEGQFGRRLHTLHKILNANYTGHNITAKTRGVNPDYVAEMRHRYPADADAPAQLAFMVEIWRQMPLACGTPMQRQWIDNFRALEPHQMRLISDEQRLLLFGLPHTRAGELYSNKLRNTGLSVSLPGIGKRVYDVPEPHYSRHILKDFNVIYDPYTPDQILALADGGRVRMMLGEYEKVSAALYDRKPGEGKLIAQRLTEQRAADQWLIDQRAVRSERVVELGVSVEQLIKGALLGDKQKQIYLEQHWKQLEQGNGAPALPAGKKKLPRKNGFDDDYSQRAFEDV
ncbi:MAG TPA: hypothetical protein VLH56_16815, partial [Dissulfurispiraceae bacterium]|nr:hypothetical protein [Dissulfurispiraceae bacterium]